MCNVQVQTLTSCCTLNCDDVSRWTICVLRFGLVLRGENVLHSVHAYCETHQISWRSVCSAQYPCLLWDSPNLLEICLFCTVSMPAVRLTKLLGDLSVLHSVHAHCEAHQTFWRSVCSAQCPCLLRGSPNILSYFQQRDTFFIFSFPPRAKKRLHKYVMQFTLLQQKLQTWLFIFGCEWNKILNLYFCNMYKLALNGVLFVL